MFIISLFLKCFPFPGCGHCKKAKPEFVSAADTFRDDPKIELAAVDCTKHREVCSANDVQGYPTIKYFSYYKTSLEYNGGRLAADFVKYLRRKSELGADAEVEEEEGEQKKRESGFGEYPGSEHVLQATDKTFHGLVAEHRVALVFFYASWCGHCKVVKPTLSEVAQQLHADGAAARVVVIDASENGRVGKEFGIKGFPTIKLFVDGAVAEEFNLARTKEAFLRFIREREERGKGKTEL